MLTTRLMAYDSDSNSVTFMKKYLTNRLQRGKINNSFSEWEKVLNSVLQLPILGPLLFNIFLDNIFLSLRKCHLVNYANGSTLYTSDKSISNIMNSLSHDFTILSKWFYHNFMVLNTDKFFFMSLGVDEHPTNLVCANKTLKNSKQEQLLGVTIDRKHNFATHLFNITKNANIKINALTRFKKMHDCRLKKKNLYYLHLLNSSSFFAL